MCTVLGNGSPSKAIEAGGQSISTFVADSSVYLPQKAFPLLLAAGAPLWVESFTEKSSLVWVMRLMHVSHSGLFVIPLNM